MNDFTGETDGAVPSTLNPQLTYSIDSAFDISPDAAWKLLQNDEAIIGGRVTYRNGDAKIASCITDSRKQNELFCKIMDVEPDQHLKRKDKLLNITAAKRLKNYAPVKAIVKLKGEITITPSVMRQAVEHQPAVVGITLRNGENEGVVMASLRGCSEASATKEFLLSKKKLLDRNMMVAASAAPSKFGPPGCFKDNDDTESEESFYTSGNDSDVVVDGESPGAN